MADMDRNIGSDFYHVSSCLPG